MRNSPVLLKAREAWMNAMTIWAKIAILFFYVSIFLTFIIMIVVLFNPALPALSFDCMLADDAMASDSKKWIKCFVRLWSLTAALFMYYVGEVAVNLPNVGTLVIYFWLVAYILWSLTVQQLDNDECVDDVIGAAYKFVLLALPTLSFIFLIVDKCVSPHRLSLGETQPLTAHD